MPWRWVSSQLTFGHNWLDYIDRRIDRSRAREMNQRPLRKRSLSIARFRALTQRCTASYLPLLLRKACQHSLVKTIATVRLIVDNKCECLVTAMLANRRTL